MIAVVVIIGLYVGYLIFNARASKSRRAEAQARGPGHRLEAADPLTFPDALGSSGHSSHSSPGHSIDHHHHGGDVSPPSDSHHDISPPGDFGHHHG